MTQKRGAAMKRNGALWDGNGNVAALVEASSGTNFARYEYGPFGEVIRATGPMAKANPLRFSTKYQDDETDLLYYGYRYYSTSTGRWVSRDPVGEKGGRNLMAFVDNNPLSRSDYLGLAASCCAPEKSCAEICQMALKNNDIAWFITGGGVVCYYGKACPCAGPAPAIGYNPGDCPFVDLVIIAHEKRHLPKVDCSKCGFYSGQDWKPGVDGKKEECEQRKQSIKELQEMSPYLDPKCKAVADKVIELLTEATAGCP